MGKYVKSHLQTFLSWENVFISEHFTVWVLKDSLSLGQQQQTADVEKLKVSLFSNASGNTIITH